MSLLHVQELLDRSTVITVLLSKSSLNTARTDVNFANDSIEILGQILTLIETNSRNKACLEGVERDVTVNVTLTVTTHLNNTSESNQVAQTVRTYHGRQVN